MHNILKYFFKIQEQNQKKSRANVFASLKVNLLRRRFLASSERQNQVQSRRFGTKIKFKQKSLNQKINQKIIEEYKSLTSFTLISS